MRRNGLIESRFRGVYVGLLILWAMASLALHLATHAWIIPAFQLGRVHAVESLIRSHEKDLLLDNHRPLRDELLRNGVLSNDRNFDEYHPSQADDQESIRKIESSCQWLTRSACISPQQALFLGGMGSDSPILASYAIALKTPYFAQVQGLLALKLLGIFGLGLLLGVVAWGIRQQEKFLLGKIELLNSSLSHVDELFRAEGVQARSAGTSPLTDEFMLASDSLKTAGALLQEKARQIETYKREFEKKTRVDQLAQTLSYTSHELKAPLQEGAQFLADLPEFLDSMPKEKLFASIRSLETRLRAGATSFQAALNATRDACLQPEPTEMAAFLESFAKRLRAQPYLKESQFRLTVDSSVMRGCRAVIRPTDIETALWNLVRNSLEAKGDCEIDVSVLMRNDRVVIDFADNGPGIPDLLLEHVFDEYYTSKTSGSGLGLSIVRKSIESSGGAIQARSSLRGARFELSFPVMTPVLSSDQAKKREEVARV